MEKTDFPYQKEDSVLFGVTYRPIIDLEIKTKFGWIPVLAYADSGVDITLLPRSFLYFLDVKFTEDEVKEIGGVGGGKVPVIVRKVELRICDENIGVKVAIGLIKDIPDLLGRKDVFDHFEICFRNLNSASIGEYVQPKFLIQIHHLLRNLGDHAMIL